MIHPHTTLRFIDETVGYGVFATKPIPKGTITYVKDALEIEVAPEAFGDYSEDLKAVIDKYSYMDERGYRIISWDFAKYVNHCCKCNSMSTGYGFEIALRDIEAGEQITDEYGIFNLDAPFVVSCSKRGCRKIIMPDDFDHLYPEWDERIRQSLEHMKQVDQPLWPMINEATREEVEAYFVDPIMYKSVYALKFKQDAGALSDAEDLATEY